MIYGAFGSWGWPRDDQIAAFDAEYTNSYLPLVGQVPYVVRLDLWRADESGRESDVYRIGAMWFDDEERYREAASTPEWEAMFARCYELIDRYQVHMRFAYVHDVGPTPEPPSAG